MTDKLLSGSEEHKNNCNIYPIERRRSPKKKFLFFFSKKKPKFGHSKSFCGNLSENDSFASTIRSRSSSFSPTNYSPSENYSIQCQKRECLMSAHSSRENGKEKKEETNEDEDIIVQCLLPNGIILDVEIHPDDDLFHIKHCVLYKATTDENIPLKGSLDPDVRRYIISYISQQGKKEELYDENRSYRELQAYTNILQFSSRLKDEKQNVFRQVVGKLIGRDLREFDDLRNCEVNDFRMRFKEYARQVSEFRNKECVDSWEIQLAYFFPPRIATNYRKPSRIDETITAEILWNDLKFIELKVSETPREIIGTLSHSYSYSSSYVSECVMKIIGEDSYLLDRPLFHYQYIREKLDFSSIPKLAIVHKDSIIVPIPKNIYPESPNSSELDLTRTLKSRKSISSYEIEEPFCFFIKSLATKDFGDLGSDKNKNLFIQCGLYHGEKPLCRSVIHPIPSSDYNEINELISFDILLCNVPRNAKLCLGIYEKKLSGPCIIFWVNTSVFDYKKKLRRKTTLHLWNYRLGGDFSSHTHEIALSPLRGTVSNPNIREASHIVLHFSDYNHAIESIIYSNKYSNILEKTSDESFICNLNRQGLISKRCNCVLDQIGNRDPLHDITEQEKELIWNVREYCCFHHPNLLPRIIDSVDYGNAKQVAELHSSLIARWPTLSPEHSLQLLDYAYPDEHVRQFGIRCLKKLTNEKLLNYMLQIVQALKHEMFLECELVEFLLERALAHLHIGQFLFWHLKAEMDSPSVLLLFGLILEAYCFGSPFHLQILENQNILLEKCKMAQFSLSKDKILSTSYFSKNLFSDSHSIFKNIVDPLNPHFRYKRMNFSKCRLMNSKMKPIMIAFQNSDIDYPMSVGQDLNDIVLMYKRGDDIRQDMLNLQLLQVMDMIWKDSGLDLRLTLYKCIATGYHEGFIEVVPNSETICSIQMASTDYKATAVFRRTLLSWLTSKNEGSMKQVQWEFTRSCAGYSVATYILGIGDRHNDNIMLKENGQMFHIDFGHFLGNFKHKFGIKRERVPLVLSDDFVDVIKADFDGTGRNFETFRELCEIAYMRIRRQGPLIISLLAMMISTGLPELNSESDLNVVRNTLHLDRSEDEALDQFRKSFDESLRNAWSISINWWFHNIRQITNTNVI